jgi:hypothetical protein
MYRLSKFHGSMFYSKFCWQSQLYCWSLNLAGYWHHFTKYNWYKINRLFLILRSAFALNCVVQQFGEKDANFEFQKQIWLNTKSFPGLASLDISAKISWQRQWNTFCRILFKIIPIGYDVLASFQLYGSKAAIKFVHLVVFHFASDDSGNWVRGFVPWSPVTCRDNTGWYHWLILHTWSFLD